MTPNLADHLLVLTLAGVLPAFGWITYQKLIADVRAGDPDARLDEYRRTTLTEWALVAVTLIVWLDAARPLAALGFDVPTDLRTLLGGVTTALGLAFLALQWLQVRNGDDVLHEQFRAAYAGATDLMPRTPSEQRGAQVLSITAGICEEVLYRGFLIAYVATFTGNAWTAAAIAAAAFGLAHSYQGRSGILKTTIVGLVAGALYVATGSLLWPIVLHVAVDLQATAIARVVLPARA